MSAFKDLTGNVYGRLSVLCFSHSKPYGKTIWTCQCSCGSIKDYFGNHLIAGNSTSCGCRRIEVSSRVNKKHGMRHTDTYCIWIGMKKRCFNPKAQYYDLYGGRGITVDPRWMIFENFLEDMGPRPPKLSIERIDNKKGYSKDNCIWATGEEQGSNKRNNVTTLYCGVTVASGYSSFLFFCHA